MLTSNQTRHRYCANTLARRLEVAAVVAEPKRKDPRDVGAGAGDRALLEAFYADRDASEAQILREGLAWSLPDSTDLIEVGPGAINDGRIVEHLRARGVGGCIVFGTSLLKGPWMAAYGGRMLNLHLGLSPYYRGSGTNLWPLYDGRPELVGATLHQIAPAVDAGDIFCQVRPDPHPDDTPHSLGNRTIRRAAEAMGWLAERFARGEASAVPVPTTGGAEYRFRDFHPDVVRVVLDRFAGGMMAAYCRCMAERRSAFPLVNEWSPSSGAI